MADDGSITAGDIEAASASQGDSPSPDPSPLGDAAVATSADAIVPPADPATGEVTSTPGAPPEQRWPSILENARREAAAKAEEAWKPYEWAKQVPQQQFDEMVGWYQRANADPVQFAQELIQSLQQHPVHGQALRSLAARALSSGRGQAEEPQPDLPLELADGRVVPVYSAAQQAKREAWLQQRAEQAFEAKLQPFREMQSQAEERARGEAATQFATTLTGSLTKLPGFTEHKAEIAQWIAKARLESDHPAEVRAAALEAYTAIVVPKLSSTVRQGVLTDLHHKAGASTVNPAQTGTAAPKSLADMTTKEALEAEFARMSG
ncbi:MAG TPA: hypothetical protein VK467_04135 [Gemmatimonadales bacterium]|nr:hypothetical protein [Gemmatimonadales bacterium]